MPTNYTYPSSCIAGTVKGFRCNAYSRELVCGILHAVYVHLPPLVVIILRAVRKAEYIPDLLYIEHNILPAQRLQRKHSHAHHLPSTGGRGFCFGAGCRRRLTRRYLGQ